MHTQTISILRILSYSSYNMLTMFSPRLKKLMTNLTCVDVMFYSTESAWKVVHIISLAMLLVRQPTDWPIEEQATGIDAWASRVKCPARFVSHLHEICIYIYIWVVYSFCLFCCLFIVVTWWYAWCIEWASGNQEEVQTCLVTLCLFIISCYSLYKTTI